VERLAGGGAGAAPSGVKITPEPADPEQRALVVDRVLAATRDFFGRKLDCRELGDWEWTSETHAVDLTSGGRRTVTILGRVVRVVDGDAQVDYPVERTSEDEWTIWTRCPDRPDAPDLGVYAHEALMEGGSKFVTENPSRLRRWWNRRVPSSGGRGPRTPRRGGRSL
jgi:hypothetical protein